MQLKLFFEKNYSVKYFVLNTFIVLSCFCAAYSVILTLSILHIPHFTPLSLEKGIIGWVTLNRYPKSQDIFFYICSVVMPAIFAVVGLYIWIIISAVIEKKYNIDFDKALLFDSISYIAFPVGLLFGVIAMEYFLQVVFIQFLGFFILKVLTMTWLSILSHSRN